MKKKLVIVLLSLVCVIACAIGLAGCSFDDKEKEYAIIMMKCNPSYTHKIPLDEENLDDGDPVTEEKWGGDEIIGYHFKGVFTEQNGRGEMIFDSNGKRITGTSLVHRQKIYCWYEPKLFKIIFDSNGGEDCEQIELLYGTELADFQFPITTKYGYDFSGWYLSGKKRNGDVDNLAFQVTDFDGFSPKGFDGEGRFAYDEDNRYSSEYTDSNGYRVYVLGTYYNWKFSLVDSTTLKLTAGYKLGSWNVNFDYDRGGIENNTVQINHGESITDDKYLKKDTGDELLIGWNTEDGVPYNGEPIERDRTLTAVWEKYKTVSFFDGSGVAEDKKVTESQPLTELPAPDKQGYRFDGWYDNAETTGESLREITYNGADSFYAKWTPVTYYVNFNGVTPQMERLSFTVEDETVLPDPPERENYAFKGWYEDEKCTKPILLIPEGTAENVRVYAKWDAEANISTYEQFIAIKDNPTGNFKLTCDINFGGNAWMPIANFAGSLNGNGYKIYNFMITTQIQNGFCGLFGVNQGRIEKLTVSDCVMNVTVVDKGTHYYGVIAGRNSGKILNCRVVQSEIKTNSDADNQVNPIDLLLGGIVGENSSGASIQNCTANINVSVNQKTYAYPTGVVGQLGSGTYSTIMLGGIAGANYSISLENCSVGGMLTVNSSPTVRSTNCESICNVHVGGIVGYQYASARVFGCSSDVIITSTIPNATTAPTSCKVMPSFGGLIGTNAGAVTKCKADGGITFVTYGDGYCGVSGGCIGYNTSGASVDNCYALTSVIAHADGSVLGGFVGRNAGTIQTSYSTGRVERNATFRVRMGGFCGENVQTGTIRNCFSESEINLATPSASDNTSGRSDANAVYGRFAAVDEGVTIKCYTTQMTKIIKTAHPNTYYDDVSGVGTEIAENELFTESFLKDVLLFNVEYWTFNRNYEPMF